MRGQRWPPSFLRLNIAALLAAAGTEPAAALATTAEPRPSAAFIAAPTLATSVPSRYGPVAAATVAAVAAVATAAAAIAATIPAALAIAITASALVAKDLVDADADALDGDGRAHADCERQRQ